MSDIATWIEDNVLVFGVICAAAFGALVATLVVVYYKCYSSKRGPNPELAQAGWVENVAQFQPVPGLANSNRNSARSGAPKSSVLVKKLLTDASTPLAEFRIILGMYYRKHAPNMAVEDIQIAVENYGDSSAGRRQLSQELLREYGQDLDEFYDGVNDGRENIPRSPPVKRKDLEPTIQYVGGGLQDTAQLTSNTNLASALEARNLGRHIELFTQNGIRTMDDVANMSTEVIELMFPPAEQEAIKSLVTAARLLTGEGDHDEV